MTKNMGIVDRVIRLVIVAVIAVLYFTNTIGGVLAIVLGVVAVAFFVTGLIGWCPSYLPFGLSTRRPSGGAPPSGEAPPPPPSGGAPPSPPAAPGA
jgi:hypothetical protein